MKINNTDRIESLDWLRGLMAFCIMLYHLSIWLFSQPTPSSFLGKMGVYGVSIFFTLSGLSMAIVYSKNINTIKKIVSFILKRFIRIIPLLFLVTSLTLIPLYLNTKQIDVVKYILNITALFGFFDNSNYIATGAWSIGNEMVYYSLTPLIIWLYNKNKIYGNIFFFFTICIAFLFAFLLLTPNDTLPNQWSIYINPFNNLFFYTAGIFIYFNHTYISKYLYIYLFIAILFFIYPIDGEMIDIVTGFNRIIFSTISILIVLIFYKLAIKLPHIISFSLETIGMATYGIYIYHPIIHQYLNSNFILNKLNLIEYPILDFIIIILITVTISVFSYNYFEIKISKYGKTIINKYL